ncbi:MAG: polysaccharide deacetylase family protein, partial [Nitrospinota bacterium]
MKKNKWIRSCLLSLILAAISISESKADNFVSIAYHDIKDTLEGDQYAVRTSDLIEQFEYFKMHGYTPVSLDDILQAGSGKKKLPQKAVLITVDDGLESFYTHFFPLIKAYQFPVVVSLVVSWLEKGGTDLNNISGAQGYKNLKVMTWEQVQEISQSGLVEIASHSYDLHRGILFNPQGNEFAAGSSFEYNRDSGTYEDRKSFRKRIFSDLKKSRDIIKEKTGKAPRVIVWPYGQFNQIG